MGFRSPFYHRDVGTERVRVPRTIGDRPRYPVEDNRGQTTVSGL